MRPTLDVVGSAHSWRPSMAFAAGKLAPVVAPPDASSNATPGQGNQCGWRAPAAGFSMRVARQIIDRSTAPAATLQPAFEGGIGDALEGSVE